MKKNVKRTTALIMIMVMLFTMIPWNNIIVEAEAGDYDPTNFKVSSVKIGKTYDSNGKLTRLYIDIDGMNLKGATVRIDNFEGGQQTLTQYRTVNDSDFLKFEISGTAIQNQDQFLGQTIKIGSYSVNINENQIPKVTETSRKVEESSALAAGALTIKGSMLANAYPNDATNPNNIIAKYGKSGSYADFPKDSFKSGTVVNGETNTNDQVKINNIVGKLGLQDIVFVKSFVDNYSFPTQGATNVAIEIRHTYTDQFRLYKNLALDGIEMRPNRGQKDDMLYFRRDTLNDYDVYFLKEIDGTDPYTATNRATPVSFKADAEGTIDVLAVKVPNLPVGEYYVVLTNKVTSGDPATQVNQEYVVNEKFTIIDANIKSKIIDIQPKSGPDSGSKATIAGVFLGSLNIPEFIPENTTIGEPVTTDSSKTELKLTYSKGTYKGKNVVAAERRIKVLIGDKATFLTLPDNNTKYDVSFTKDLDKLTVMTAQCTDADTNPEKSVVVETETIFTLDDGQVVIIKERAENTQVKYTYIPSKVAPEVISASPNKIQVSPGGTKNFRTTEARTISILGKNFMINKFTDNNSNIIVRYPSVEIGEIVLDKNTNPAISIKVLDSNGKELDGSQGSEIGTQILVTIPADSAITNLGKTYVKVTNPVRNSTNPGLSSQASNIIEFVNPESNKNPVISSVEPNIVTVEGGEEVQIKGSNFADGVKVFIDGTEVTGIKRDEDGKKITFNSPKGTEGEKQLQVMNPEGGMATYLYRYVKTFTNPKITDFSPKSGNTGTLVVISGDNFLKADPVGSEADVFRLIGTRVLLEGKDINAYNIDSNTKKITFQNYTAPTPSDTNPVGILLRVVDGKLKLESYYNAVLLKTPEGKYYSIDVDAKGNPVISDGITESYTVTLSGNSMKADKKGGEQYDLTAATDAQGDYIKVSKGSESITMHVITPYEVKNGIITGCNVKVIDKTQIIFKVPALEGDGYYDVTIQNPDTKKDSKIDENGFYYFKQPQTKPTIVSVDPPQGSTSGGYSIIIRGTEFEDNGTTKTKVFINGTEVKAENTKVVNSNQIIAVVPPYPGDLRADKGTDTLDVPLVIVNPDGGSASLEKGFTYVVPSSHPEISKIVPTKGSAAGGEVVEITAKDIRYFEPYDDLNRNQIYDDGEAYFDINNNKRWDSEVDFGTANDWREPINLEPAVKGYSKYYSSLVLPKIYFGAYEAKIVEFSKGYLKVLTPPGTAGKVNVFIVNNDSGISNKVEYTYEASNPAITSILPDQGKKQGGDKLEIHGSGFAQGEMIIYNGKTDSSGNALTDTKIMPIIRFGDISNRDLKREEENSGRIDNGHATVRLDGNLTVEYYQDTKKLRLQIEEGQNIYVKEIMGYEGNIRYVPLSLLKDSKDAVYTSTELIKVEVLDRRLIAERGYSPNTKLVSTSQLTVITPSYYTVGEVNVTIFNPDGGKASGKFTYKNPDSKPKITNITKEGKSPIDQTLEGKAIKVVQVTYKGGNTISIIGEDFRENAVIKISDVVEIGKDKITYTLPTKLTFKMPLVNESAVGKLHRVYVINEDGGVADSEAAAVPIYIQFIKGETAPKVTSVTPDSGPASGGTRVKIEGADFRQGLSVLFGGTRVPETNITVADYKTIYVTTPSHTPGKVEVIVENPDGELSNPNGSFNFLSSPKIMSIVDPTDSTEKTKINTISILGNEEIKIKGSGFMDKAKVYFNPSIEKANDTNLEKGIKIYIGGTAYILLSGTEAKKVTYVDGETLNVTTPEGKVDTKGVIVINPDNGATEIYLDIKYVKPDLTAPTGVTAELYGRYIKVKWNAVKDATAYEVYVIQDGNGTEFLVTTELTEYLFTDVLPVTSYKFIVRALGNFGSSKPSAVSNTVKTGEEAGPEDDDDGIMDRNKAVKVGNTAVVTIGRMDFDEKQMKVDLTRGELAGSTKVSISIPAKAAIDIKARDVIIIADDFTLKFNPTIFNIEKMQQNKTKDDAGIRFTLSKVGEVEKNKGSYTLSNVYEIGAKAFIGRDETVIENLKSDISFVLDYNDDEANKKKCEKILLMKYDEYDSKWLETGYKASKGEGSINAEIDELGKFAIIGSRR